MIEPFGTTKDGRVVHRVTLTDGDLTARILTYGIALQELRHAALPYNLTIGFGTLAPYEGELYHLGTLMGPVANRIAGANAQIDGKTFHFDKNFQDAHVIHGGSGATHAKVWEITANSDNEVTLTTHLPDCEAGFPGNRQLWATFSLTQDMLILTLEAKSDAPTLISLANHSYWNLGPDPTTSGHVLHSPAARYLPTDPATFIPTGEIAAVVGTRYDYRQGREIKAGSEGLLDNNLCLDCQAMNEAATLTGPTGVTMRMETNAPGLQIFDGHMLGEYGATDTDGRALKNYAGLALEAQHWPNAPHNPDFPDITLRPDETYRQVTRWSFNVP